MSDRRIWFWLGGLAIVVLLVYLLRGILLPFVAGMAIAYMLDPICDRIEKWVRSRTLATLAVVVGFLLLCVTVLLLLVPLLQSQIADLTARLPELIAALIERARPLLQRLEPHLGTGESGEVGTVLRGQAGGIVNWLGGATGAVLSGSIAFANVLALVFITPVVAFYLLRDWDRLVERIDALLPREHVAVIREQAREIDRTLGGYLRGQALVCLFLGSFYAIGLTLAGLDFGLSVGLLTGILSFIPYVGTIVGFVTSMGLAFFQFTDWIPIGIVAAIFVAGQFIEGNFLQPKLVGERVGLHPVWVIFALLAGGALFGFVGVLLGLPVAAMAGVLIRFAQRRYLDSRLYRGERAATLIVPDPSPPGHLHGSEDRASGEREDAVADAATIVTEIAKAAPTVVIDWKSGYKPSHTDMASLETAFLRMGDALRPTLRDFDTTVTADLAVLCADFVALKPAELRLLLPSKDVKRAVFRMLGYDEDEIEDRGRIESLQRMVAIALKGGYLVANGHDGHLHNAVHRTQIAWFSTARQHITEAVAKSSPGSFRAIAMSLRALSPEYWDRSLKLRLPRGDLADALVPMSAKEISDQYAAATKTIGPNKVEPSGKREGEKKSASVAESAADLQET